MVVASFTFAATAGAVRLTGAAVVFSGHLWPGPRRRTRRDHPRTAAVIPVHLFGRPAAMGNLTALVQQQQLALVADATQAHGAAAIRP